MAEEAAKPDFRNGFPIEQIPDGGSALGRVDADDAILVRRGDELFAVGAHCTHYHAPLIDGFAEGGVLRCPWLHALFDLSTGEALNAPAFAPQPLGGGEPRRPAADDHDTFRACVGEFDF